MSEGELKNQLIKQINLETKEWSLAQNDKIIMLEYLINIIDSVKKDILEFSGTLKTNGEPCLIIHKSKFEKWFGDSL